MADLPLIVSHRGDRKSAVENTIQASQLSIDQGANGLEIDIRQCATGEIVVFHDFSLKRMFNRSGYIGRTSLQDLKQTPYVHEYNDEVVFINTLDEYLDHFKNTVPINLDAKTIHFFDFKFADLIIDTVKNHRLTDTVWISCFNPFLLQIIKLKDKNIRTGYLFQRMTWMHTTYDLTAFSDAWHPRHDVVTEALVEKAFRLKKELHVWTVNDADLAKRLAGYPVHGLITDDVRLVKQSLKEL